VIDLHTHILPGIDDGVKTEDEAVEFARTAVADGVRTIVATPHCKDGSYENDLRTVLERVASLRQRLAAEGVEVDLVPGAEVHLCANLVERIRDGRAPTLADNGKTLLLELSLTQYPPEMDNLIFQLRLAGIVPVLAHPERIGYFRDDPKRYEALVRLGAFGQITTGSVLGVFGKDVAVLSEWMIRRGLVHVLASDSHNTRGRPPILSEARRAVARLVGEDAAGRMVEDVPAALLRGEEPAAPVPEEDPEPRRSIWSRLLRRGGS
jgi:protein-tyrosine phosphatase